MTTVDAAPLHVDLLGELSIRLGSNALDLPPSKKTRALLAFLVASERSHRRERLCSMFWDVADDPRAALRWSLSKLRLVVNHGDQPRLVTDRDSVSFAPNGASVDLLEVRRALRDDVALLSTASLEALARRFRGEFLQGLELLEFHDFQAWCVAQREDARRLHVKLLQALVARLEGDPEAVIEHAKTLVHVDPMDSGARAALIRRLGELGRQAEALEHYRSCERLYRELGSAPPEEVVTAVRLARAGRVAATVEAEPRSSGRSSLVHASEGPTSQRLPALPLLVGRDDLVARLRAMLARVVNERRRKIVLLTGEPGLGKSRLLSELEAQAYQVGVTVLAGKAYEAELGRPYGIWIDALRRLLRRGPSQSAQRELEHLIPELSDAQHPDVTRDQLFAAVAAFVRHRAVEAGAIGLLFDDVQWCDEASVSLLHYVLRTTSGDAVLAALAGRDGEVADNVAVHRLLRGLARDDAFEAMPLPRLDAVAVALLVSQLAPALDANSIFRQSGGNPLFACELVCSLAEGHGERNAGLSELVSARVERLPAEAADVVRWGAILGSVFTVAHLEALAALSFDELARALELLERHALLRVEDEHYAFAHDVVRQHVYSGLSTPRRRLMHRRAAEALQQLGPDEALAGEVARHAALAGQFDVAARACTVAARRCARLFANAQAEALVKNGLHYAEPLPEEERVVLSLELMEIHFAVRRPNDLERYGTELERLSRRAMDFGRLEYARLGFSLISYLRWEQGDWSDAKRSSLAAEFVSRSTDDRERMLAISEAARCLVILERELPDAEALALEATALADRLGLAPAPLADALGLLRLQRGEFDAAERYFREARECAHRDGLRILEFQTLSHALMLEVQRDRYEAALELCGELLSLGEKLREGSELPFARAAESLCWHALGRAGGRARLDEAVAALRDVDAKHRLAFILTRSAELDRGFGSEERARAQAREALQVAEVLERPSEQVLALVTLAWLAYDDEGEREARRLTEAASDLVPLACADARRRWQALSERQGSFAGRASGRSSPAT